MNSARNLVLVGPMGAGKTSIGRRLAERLGLRFVDADREIEQRTGASVGTIFDCEGEQGFRAREREVLAELLLGEGQLLATGGGAVLDEQSRQLMRERACVVHLHASVEEQLRRLARDRSRPLLQRPDRAAVLQRLAETRAPLYAQVAHLRIDTDHLTSAESAARLQRLLAEHGVAQSPAAGAAANQAAGPA
ncbi:MAG TPA: shikimate kinase [Xanthomonadaceae bacterium]|nr:shikimate kinase [Xanthomonadaceae bacterium]